MRAGLVDITRAMSAQVKSSITVRTTLSAVSSPIMPNAASTKACSLS